MSFLKGPRLPILGAGLLLIALTGLSHQLVQSRRDVFPPEDDLVYLPRVSVLRALALGHTEAMADLVFIRTLTYFASEFFGSRDYHWLKNHIDTVTELDPQF